MGHHHIVVEILPGLAQVLLRRVGAKVHARGIDPDEKRLVLVHGVVCSAGVPLELQGRVDEAAKAFQLDGLADEVCASSTIGIFK